MSGDSENVFLHCGVVLGVASHACQIKLSSVELKNVDKCSKCKPGSASLAASARHCKAEQEVPEEMLHFRHWKNLRQPDSLGTVVGSEEVYLVL